MPQRYAFCQKNAKNICFITHLMQYLYISDILCHSFLVDLPPSFPETQYCHISNCYKFLNHGHILFFFALKDVIICVFLQLN